jgi:hypothetical protein
MKIIHNQPEDHEEENFLPGNGKQNPFSTPEGYFEKLPYEIADRVHTSKSGTIQSILSFKTIMISGVAAMLLVVAMFLINKRNEVYKHELTAEDITTSVLMTEIEESVIIDELQSSSFAEVTPVAENEHIHDYLIENQTDITLIINEL